MTNDAASGHANSDSKRARCQFSFAGVLYKSTNILVFRFSEIIRITGLVNTFSRIVRMSQADISVTNRDYWEFGFPTPEASTLWHR